MKNTQEVNLKALNRDLIFIIFGYVCLYFYKMHEPSYSSPMLMSGAVAILLIIIHIFPTSEKENKNIYENKKAIIPFIAYM